MCFSINIWNVLTLSAVISKYHPPCPNELTNGGGPCTYVYCVFIYHVIAVRFVKCGYVFAHRYTLGDDSECPMNYELSFLQYFFTGDIFLLIKLLTIFCAVFISHLIVLICENMNKHP